MVTWHQFRVLSSGADMAVVYRLLGRCGGCEYTSGFAILQPKDRCKRNGGKTPLRTLLSANSSLDLSRLGRPNEFLQLERGSGPLHVPYFCRHFGECTRTFGWRRLGGTCIGGNKDSETEETSKCGNDGTQTVRCMISTDKLLTHSLPFFNAGPNPNRTKYTSAFSTLGPSLLTI
jgi:hypothetical protein